MILLIWRHVSVFSLNLLKDVNGWFHLLLIRILHKNAAAHPAEFAASVLDFFNLLVILLCGH